MRRDEFEAYVWEAVESLPPFFKDRIDNVAFIVQDYPGEEAHDRDRALPPGQRLLGLYHGVPLPERSVWSHRMLPDAIYLYQRNIEAVCRSREEIKRQIYETVLHELGHYFGLEEDQLRAIEEQWQDQRP